MKDILALLYRNGLSINSVLYDDKENFEIVPAGGHFRRALYLSGLSFLLGLFVIGAGILLPWLIQLITGLSFFGYTGKNTNIPAEGEAGLWMLFIPIAGTALSLLFTRRHSLLLKIPAMVLNIGTGISLGAEGPVMMTGGALAAQGKNILRISEREVQLLYMAGAATGLAWYFGTPISALFLALEVFLTEWALMGILPVLTGVVTGSVGHYLLYGSNPFFTMGSGPAVNGMAILAYTCLGLLIGLLSVLMIKASRYFTRLFHKMEVRHYWWLLLAAVPAGIAGYLAPESLGTGEWNGSYLLQAHVTLQLLFVLSIVKLISWLLFSAASNTGTTVMPLLIIGGALGLFLAVLLQLIFPSVIINPVMAALIGMSAMFAGVSRAVLTAIVFALELTHHLPAALPVGCAAIAAFAVSYPLIGSKRREKPAAL